MKVLIDTNSFLLPHQFGVDIFGELARLGYHRCLVLRAVIYELNKLAANSTGKDKIAAKVGLSLVDRCEIIETEQSALVDDIITNIAVKQKLAVCTNDLLLKKRLSTKGITVVYLRQKHRLSI
ncbi:MAG: Ribonuclease VapC9 [Candidatus Argoarchaeum ethanivorans]|uniref:Ribonuclease VapC9 n=1 Tax=Candidatus Argoarchaeum ethanivorans TaxID=2608793 RepID=A0A811TI62_9EURY|nr:MAG: Ribonuclease VapC9 [Candidatus Argoarchaeum ethanivorans]